MRHDVRQLAAWTRRGSATLLVLAALVAAVAAAGGMWVFLTVVEHKEEARDPFFRVVELTDDIDDPAVWGKNFPRQYDGYRRTVDQVRTRFGGSEAEPRAPTEKDPREVVAQSRLVEDPRLVTMWAGYAFAKDFREERGHAFMLEDQIYTERQDVVKQPGACLHCHGSMYLPYKKAGNGDIMEGFAKLNPLPYAEARKGVSHPVACIDCHDATSMKLRITRPGFIEGIKSYQAFLGNPDYDVNRDASHQEMRSYVCGQCHVEYYFKGPEKRLTYPWAKGLQVDNILSYYDEVGHKDWVHAESGAPVLKAQHPEFEMWSQGIHARSGVACADCHMPYLREGAMKVSDHHVRSPLLNVAGACQTCHRWSEDELKGRVDTIQLRTFEMRNRSMDALLALISDIKTSQAAGGSDEVLAQARSHQRSAQFYLDFVEAENSMGFHAPQEAARILNRSLDESRLGQLTLRPLMTPAPATPDVPPAPATP